MKRALVLVLLLAGCDGPTESACTETRNPVELVAGDVFYQFNVDLLAKMRNEGWDCSGTETIRNGAGVVIGTRYNCHICRR
jgi:hypothetical protein